MTELKCPFCDKPLQPTHRIEDEYFCENYDCPQTSLTWIGTSSLWKAFTDTKKKLDMCEGALEEYKDWFNKSQERLKIAVDALEMIGSGNVIEHSVVGHEDDNKIFIANKALQQIKDNDKDVK